MRGLVGSASTFCRNRRMYTSTVRSVIARSCPPHRVQKLLPAEDHSRAAHQKFQQPELGGRQRKQIPVQTRLATGAVQFQAARFQHARGRVLGAKLQLDPGNQFPDEKRLHDVVVGAQFQANNAIGF